MMRAAGILFVDPTGKVLLMRRTGHDQVGMWALPGGGLEGEETAEEAARRETLEETGLEFKGPLTAWTRRVREDLDFTTFIASVKEFVPTLNEEHDQYQWVDRTFALGVGGALHPGVKIALLRFDMDELGIAKAIVSGELCSPQRYGNLLLVAMRITGTGASYRRALDEYVWRDSSLYLHPEFLERCNGLPVILEHPKGKMLDTVEFRDRIAGTIFLPYFKDDEVWGIAKILDMEVAEMLETETMSTSPAVVFMNATGSKFAMTNGKTLLIEGKPSLLDHVALTPLGVWDKGGPPTGVESIDAEIAAKLDSAVAIVRESTLDQICRLVSPALNS